ncbi:type II toxin-antitoxin system VapC family toxin [Georgenia subflava]|uniref:PIN domain-containing protein n=1 Tax=Georgenia subflava TaxID=1622177 RepID=A0A6N7EJS8_9MICO|nr:type II toxin-antitoxin system VapC family toxin [Georgenia subflava]MPV37328.1 PIN domain-containing protein [Georgenia subflava]
MGVRYLLDTHVVLWLLGDPDKVPSTVREQLADRSNELLVSAVSAMEAATKVRLGKLEAARPLVTTWSVRTAEIGAAPVPLSTEAALLAGSLEWEHRDPFDRLLVAQAIEGNHVLVTSDAALQVPGVRILGW